MNKTPVYLVLDDTPKDEESNAHALVKYMQDFGLDVEHRWIGDLDKDMRIRILNLYYEFVDICYGPDRPQHTIWISPKHAVPFGALDEYLLNAWTEFHRLIAKNKGATLVQCHQVTLDRQLNIYGVEEPDVRFSLRMEDSVLSNGPRYCKQWSDYTHGLPLDDIAHSWARCSYAPSTNTSATTPPVRIAQSTECYKVHVLEYLKYTALRERE